MNRAIQTGIVLILLVSSSFAGETTFYTPPDSLWHDSPDMLVPDFDIQKVMGYDTETRNDVTVNLYLFVQQMAKFKMNRLIIDSPIFFFLKYETTTDDNDPDVPVEKRHWSYADYFAEFFDYCRSLHIEPIPSLGDWPSALLRHNGNCLECSIFDSQYIEDNGLVPGPGDYYYTEPTQGINQYPYPMPQPSWEFTLEKENIDGEVYPRYYFADHKVSVWTKTQEGGHYDDVKTMDYRVYDEADFHVTLEVWNEGQNKWDPLTSGYTLHNVGLNDGNTSYYRFCKSGFYGDENQDDWAYITFDNSIPEGTQIRVSYAAPINMGFIWSWWGDRPLPQRFSTWTCMSYFDDSDPPDPVTEDTPANWTTWNSRDIWYVALYEIINWLKPRYIDIQHCEQLIMHTDKRCREDRKNSPDYPRDELYHSDMQVWEHNAWICGHEIEFLRQTIADLDDDLGGNAQMMMLADMFDSHNGRYAEGRCQWNWYPNYDRDPVHQPDIDDNWVGNANSHIYYQPAMGGMGGWTWDTGDPGMMASQYVTDKDSLVMWEWGYQDGYFDDRDPENVILWQDKFAERYRDLADQGFTNFVGGCAGYALALEGRDWGGIAFRCEDRYGVPEELPGTYYNPQNPLDGTNLNWALIKGNMKKKDQDEIDINLYLNACAQDPVYSPDHLDPDTEKGCHIGTVQDGIAYLDDVSLKDDNVGKIIFNPSFTVGLEPWEIHHGVDFAKWEWNGEEGHNSPGCCRLTIDRDGYSYNTSYEYISQNYSESLGELKDLNLEFSVWAKTIKLDGLRHLNVKSWMDLTYNYKPHQQETVLGMINTQWGEVRNYSSESTSADWMWSKKYPTSAFIKYLYCDPYYLFQGDNMNNWGDQFRPNAPYPNDIEEILP